MKTNFQKGFTLIEGIIAITIASLGLVLIFSLLAMSLDVAVKSAYCLEEARLLNCLADQLRNELDKEANLDIDRWLNEHYPEFTLVEYYQTGEVWVYQVDHQGQNYFISRGGGNNQSERLYHH